jgi:hypothetical protein
MTLLNSPVEVSIRLLTILDHSFPNALGIHRLVLFDHALVHSADLGGPASLHPDIPGRVGELGVRRQLVEQALDILLRVELAEVAPERSGIVYRASESAHGFLRIIDAHYVDKLQDRSSWVVGTYGSLADDEIRSRFHGLLDRWSEEFENWTQL